MKAHHAACLGASFLFFWCLLAVKADQVVRLRVDPMVALAPSDLRMVIYAETNEHNVAIRLICDGSHYYSSSEYPIHPERDPATRTVWYRDLPGGDYTVTAILYRHDHKTFEAGRASASVLIKDAEDR